MSPFDEFEPPVAGASSVRYLLRRLAKSGNDAVDGAHPAAAKDLAFEGIIAKRKDSPYESGDRTGVWVKYRVSGEQEFVIGGVHARQSVDALIVGYYQGERLL